MITSQSPMRGSLFLLLACFCLEACTAVDYITITQPLLDSKTIVSSGQTFKLGFFRPANNSDRYVGIMFNVPAVAVVWVANRDRPLNDSSGTLTISGDGNLVVLNGQKEILWSSNVSNSVANSTAQLLDTGNLVLTDNSSGRTLWESFQIPTNSYLRWMRLSSSTKGQKIRLTSWRSPSDPSIGSFSLGVEPQQIPQLFLWNDNKPYWRSGPWNGNVFIGIPGMDPVYLNDFNLVTDDTGLVYATFTYANDTALLYYELSSSGSLLEKFLSDREGDWEVTWSSPRSPCDVYGKCGPFGSCNPHGSPICTCLQGFEPRDKVEWEGGNWTSGCTRRAMLQCERNNSVRSEGKQDGFLKLPNTKVPDLAEWVATSEDECGTQCSNNCPCVAYASYPGIGCMHWTGSLIDIQQFPSSDGADLYIRVPYSELGKKRDMKSVIATSVIAASLSFALSAYFCWKWLAKQKGKEDQISLIEAGEVYKVESLFSHNLEQPKLEELPLYSYETLANATDDFEPKNELGKGGFGPVYKGKLLNGQQVAVKRLSNSSNQGIKEFMNEVVLISKLQHRNLVRLLGCCVQREEKMLVYEYMPNKSLDFYVIDSKKRNLLDWDRRKFIIEGIGRGLLYLHRDSRLKIIHRDLKLSNILLDEELNPKISDFGLARIFGGNQDQANTNRVVGTYGYMAPEYAMGGQFSEKSDVYSFGILLLEIVSGKKNTSFHYDENKLSLIGYAWKLWNIKQAIKLLDPLLSDPRVEVEVSRYVHAGILCVQESASDRPNMSNVLSMLNSEIAELPPPKLPAYTATLGLSESESSQHSVNDVSFTTLQGR
ncbi:G-type lectin S-receptor-like serine/threonine-protein kinase At1g11330 [Coffea eugenioides]|uniref:G-type lectin S-receptor-like serine/threonine-protein kinase At1g11330 n=1 Tax=Coffea eugenioides TaxID=49369 RepID=UPI000F61165D|nr:G-type lectin S-receptor-like serine/threonine-protein kinase At1g11330 [Coffea eugenioides]